MTGSKLFQIGLLGHATANDLSPHVDLARAAHVEFLSLRCISFRSDGYRSEVSHVRRSSGTGRSSTCGQELPASTWLADGAAGA